MKLPATMYGAFDCRVIDADNRLICTASGLVERDAIIVGLNRKRAPEIYRYQILEILDRLDAIEKEERTVMDNDGIAALIELSDLRNVIREALT